MKLDFLMSSATKQAALTSPNHVLKSHRQNLQVKPSQTTPQTQKVVSGGLWKGPRLSKPSAHSVSLHFPALVLLPPAADQASLCPCSLHHSFLISGSLCMYLTVTAQRCWLSLNLSPASVLKQLLNILSTGSSFLVYTP